MAGSHSSPNDRAALNNYTGLNDHTGLNNHTALDDLIALSDEMAALVRAGVPLEHGLAQVAHDLGRRPGKLASDISHRMQAGESLLHVIETSPNVFPPVYRAVVAAGLKAGRLPAALEGLATAIRQTADLRRYTRAATIYPIFIALLAFGLFVAGLVYFQPRIEGMYESMEVPASQLNTQLTAMGQQAFIWAPWFPLAVIAVFAAAWYFSSRSTANDPLLLRITPAGRMLHFNRFAAFSDTLALLIDHGVTLDEAVVLAAEACGDQNIRSAADELATDVKLGIVGAGGSPAPQQASPPSPRPTKFPPLVGWLLTSGCPAPALADSLRSSAEAYRRRAVQLDDWLRLYLPLLLTLVIGGTAVTIYALSMLGPWYEMLTKIAVKG